MFNKMWPNNLLGLGSYDGVFMKQDIGQQKPLYVKDDKVIAWASHWGHWWIQDSEDAGKNQDGYWLQQDDKDSCPGSEKVVVREGGSDRVKNVTITPSSQCNVKYFDIKSLFNKTMKHSY